MSNECAQNPPPEGLGAQRLQVLWNRQLQRSVQVVVELRNQNRVSLNARNRAWTHAGYPISGNGLGGLVSRSTVAGFGPGTEALCLDLNLERSPLAIVALIGGVVA